MAIYGAIVQNGDVVGIATFPDDTVFDDSGYGWIDVDTQTSTIVVDVTNEEPRPEVGWTYTVQGGFAPPSPPETTPAEDALAALAAGVTVNSTGTPAINALIDISQTSLDRMMAVNIYILVNSAFPLGLSSFPWPTYGNESAISFSSTTLFQTWSSAIADYVIELQGIVLSNTGELPSSTITIA